MLIRHAKEEEIYAIKRIADANRESIGFVVRTCLKFSVLRKWLLVAIIDDEIVGFANYRHRLDSQTTLYEICVREQERGQGIGRALINTIKAESEDLRKARLVLKCPMDLTANNFYRHLGFELARWENGKKKVLNVWEASIALPVLP